MERTYKAVLYSKNQFDPRWAIVDAETGEMLDDAQGYGFKSPRKAYAAYVYKLHHDVKRGNAERKKR